MKKILFILISLVSITVSAQGRDSVYIKTDIYECVYSEVLEQPKFIRYTVQCPNGTASRIGMDFYISGDLKTSDDKDYTQNVYDKGHMAPAADFNCTKEMLYKTFSYVNCALQHQELNRITWRLLEAKERVLAQNYTVSVEIRLIFDKTCTKLPTGATVPKAFYKTIYIKETKQVLKYYFINEKPISSNPENYLIK